MEELLNALKDINSIRAKGFYEDYEPEGKHKDTIYFATDTNQVYLNDKSYGSSNDFTNELKEKLNNLPLAENIVLKEEGKGLSTNDYTDTDKAKLANTYTKTEVNNKVEGLGVTLSDTWDAQLVGAFNNLDNKKVDKVDGKQLSTEDFTTLLKQKLEQLAVDVPDIDERLTALKTSLDTILDSDNATTVIDTFQEIENFLQGVTNTQTLTGLLQEMKSEIVELCANKYIPLVSGVTYDNTTADYLPMRFHTKSQADKAANKYIECWQSGSGWFNFLAGKYIVNGGTSSQFLKADGSVDGTAYLPKVYKCPDNDGWSAIGLVYRDYNDNTAGAFGEMFNNGVYQYSYIGWGNAAYNKLNNFAVSPTEITYKDNKVFHSGNDGSGSGLDADLLDGKHSTAYLPITAYNKSDGCLVKTKIVSTSNEFFIVDITGNSNSGNYPIHTIVNFYNYDANNIIDSPKAINYGYDFGEIKVFNKDGYVYLWFKQKTSYTLFSITAITQSSPGNVIDTVTNAGMPTEGVTRLVTITPKQVALITDNVASADKLTTKQLTNEDLNAVVSKDLRIFFLGSGNTCSNTPFTNGTGILQVCGINDTTYINQIFTTTSGVIYKRVKTTSWSSWQQLATTDGEVAKLTTKQLTNEDLNEIISKDFVSYTAANANNVVNKPTGVTGFYLQVFGYSTDNFTCQILTTIASGDSYKRYKTLNGWSSWQRMLTEDDLSALAARVTALENK